MPPPASSTTDSVPTGPAIPVLRVCTYCGSSQLHSDSLPRSWADRVFALHHYRCAQCRNHQRRFHFSWAIVGVWLGALVIFAGLASGAGYLWVNRWQFFSRKEDTGAATVDALARARTSAGGLSSFEQMMVNKPRPTMDNATILKLWQAEVSSDVILQLIRTSNADYDVSADAIIELRQEGVDQNVILAIIDASYRAR